MSHIILSEIGLVISSESSEFSVLFTDSPLRVKLTVEWVLPLSEVTIISFESLSLDHFQESLILMYFIVDGRSGYCCICLKTDWLTCACYVGSVQRISRVCLTCHRREVVSQKGVKIIDVKCLMFSL